MTYDYADPSPLTTGSGSGFWQTDGVSASCSRGSGETAASSPYHITATLSATVAGALNNYDITNAGADFTINKKEIGRASSRESEKNSVADASPKKTSSDNGLLLTDRDSASHNRPPAETRARR